MDNAPREKSRKKLSGPRKMISKRMAQSLRDLPQLTAMFSLEADRLLELKDELKAKNKNVTVTSLIVRLMATVLQEYPLINSAVDGEQLVCYESCNVGVGIGLPQGILVVVIKEAQDKNIFEISDEMKKLNEQVRSGELAMADMEGSTFTISSIGVQGLSHSTVVLNPPENAMLAVGVTEKRPVVLEDGSIGVKSIMSFSFTHNHAVLDGYHVGEAVRLLRERMNDPKAYMGL